jgi:[protein-PII] uridylyltransferase
LILKDEEKVSYLRDQREELKRLHESGAAAGRDLARRHAANLDVYIISVFRDPWERISPGEANRRSGITIMALGGYGRRELSPFSDIDLLFLCPQDPGESLDQEIRPILYPLWDAGYQVGYSIRSLKETLALAREDLTVVTALLDARKIAGNPHLFQEWQDRFWEEILAPGKTKWIHAIIQGAWKRHQKYRDPSFLIQPQLKEGEGGLRDIHTLLWLNKIYSELKGPRDLEHFPGLSPQEVQALRGGTDFLLKVRNQLHFFYGRHQDQLFFEDQERMARFLSYQDQGDFPAVEEFMRDLTVHLTRIRTLSAPIFREGIRKNGKPSPRPPLREKELEPGVWMEGGEIQIEGSSLLEHHPELILKLFLYLAREEKPFSLKTRQGIREALLNLREAYFQGPEPTRIFLDILSFKKAPQALEVLWEMEILFKIFPELKPTFCRVQYDAYHLYTVDTHLLYTFEEMAGMAQNPLELTGRLFKELEDPLLIYLGALFHDLGKGKGKDHARKGAELIPALSQRLGLKEKTRDTLAFLVAHHLLLAETAQRRDLNDERLMVETAQVIQDPERLKMLCLLTLADARATGPRAWTNWKAQLLKELFFVLLRILEGGELATTDASETMRLVKSGLRETLVGKLGPEAIEKWLSGLAPRYLLSFPATEISGHILLMESLKSRNPAWDLQPGEEMDQTVICAHDHPGLFAKLAGVFTLHNLNILGAQVHTPFPGIALDVFQVTKPVDPLSWKEQWDEVFSMMEKVLTGKISLEYRLSRKGPPPLRDTLSGPPKVPQVRISNQDSDFYTILEVYAQDRMGLLYDITKTLTELRLDIHLAKISTKVDQVVDVFYLSDFNGEKLTDPEKIEELIKAIRFQLSMVSK